MSSFALIVLLRNTAVYYRFLLKTLLLLEITHEERGIFLLNTFLLLLICYYLLQSSHVIKQWNYLCNGSNSWMYLSTDLWVLLKHCGPFRSKYMWHWCVFPQYQIHRNGNNYHLCFGKQISACTDCNCSRNVIVIMFVFLTISRWFFFFQILVQTFSYLIIYKFRAHDSACKPISHQP